MRILKCQKKVSNHNGIRFMPTEKNKRSFIVLRFSIKYLLKLRGIIILSPCGSFIDDKCQNLLITN